jgi:hypothetical protein
MFASSEIGRELRKKVRKFISMFVFLCKQMLILNNNNQLAFLTPPFLGYFFANPASVTPSNGDIL